MNHSEADEPEYQRLLAGDDGVDLPRLLLELDRDAYPLLDAPACLAQLAAWGQKGAQRLAELPSTGRDLKQRLAAISRLLYANEGFHGNTESYYDPRNSYLHQVVMRRTGIPITLAAVYVAVAQQAGLPAYGVATPGHFVVGCQEMGRTWYIDPFTDGDVLTQEACRHRIERMTGEPGVLRPEHFRPATALEIAVRVLRNLKGAYAREDRWAEVFPVQRRLAQLLPAAADEIRDLGLVYLRLGQPSAALEWLDRYQQHCSPEQAEAMAPYLQTAKRLLAELN